MPTNLPPAHEHQSPHLDRLGVTAAWAGFVVVLGMFIVGVIYWSSHTSDAKTTTGAQTLQTTGSSAALKSTTTGSGSAVR